MTAPYEHKCAQSRAATALPPSEDGFTAALGRSPFGPGRSDRQRRVEFWLDVWAALALVGLLGLAAWVGFGLIVGGADGGVALVGSF
ncbi:hypothetical protein DWF04_005960 [Cereibacter sphaeroides f. sp. denitrificans]|nr:hypothetical protein DWF04_06235 [Cereibacter sphaeroides f. sp. denitrificans]